MHAEFLEIVCNGKPTGSVLKGTLAVSDTKRKSVVKVHHQIRLRILSCSRMSENHRGPEVPEVKVRVEECLDGFARVTSKELATTHSVKNGILQYACFTSRRMDADLGKIALMRIARSMNSLGCTQRQCEISKDIVDNYRTMFESRISAGSTKKLPCSEISVSFFWSYDMEGHAKKMCGAIL